VIDLVRTFQQILERAKSRPVLEINDDAVTVGQMIEFLRRRLTLEEKPIRLKQLLHTLNSRQGLICMFLALLELIRLQAIQVKQENLFGEILVRKHNEFDNVMQEQAMVRDDWR
jgi:segregation and condensation protein A